jgi:hypothetical protein
MEKDGMEKDIALKVESFSKLRKEMGEEKNIMITMN